MAEYKNFPVWKKATFIFILTTIIVCFVEITATLCYFFLVSHEKRQNVEKIIDLIEVPYAIASRFIPHPYFNYVCNPNFRYPDGFKPHNSYGFRMPEWPTEKNPGIIRMIALGGSTTFGFESRDGRDVWPAMLAEQLNSKFSGKIEIINLGIYGSTAFEMIGVMAMIVPQLEPDVVLIHCGFNDAFATAYKDEGGMDNTFFRFAFNQRPIPAVIKKAIKKSYFARLLALPWLTKSEYAPTNLNNAMQKPHPSANESLANASLSSGKYFIRNIKTLIAIAFEIHAFPVLIDHALSSSWEKPKSKYYEITHRAVLRNNMILERIAREKQIPFINLYPYIRDPKYFVDIVHESPEGMKLKTTILAEKLEPIVDEIIKNQK